MWKAGELDASLAMQLMGNSVAGKELGSANATTPETTEPDASSHKRPAENMDPHSPEELEDVLNQAKVAKTESWCQ